jgi:asparagine synthase (glutamine-hydrolysing)
VCGITGYVAIGKDVETHDIIRRMTRAIAHRGPDDEGILLIAPSGGKVLNLSTDHTAADVTGVVPSQGAAWPHRVAFGHRRFSIVDISPNGHQPFWSSDGSICVCFNGELYNYVELRSELERLGHRFRTSSDTEVFAEAFLRWGTGAFDRFVGFWALSLYDARVNRVLLARDRLGKASLYLSRTADKLLWSSEIKGLRAGTNGATGQVREQAVSDFVVRGWRDGFERTFFENVETFPRSSWAWIEKDGSFSPTRYWAPPTTRLSESEISTEEAAGRLRDTLAEALRVRFRADVPVGFELSGGLDSSSLLAIGASRGQEIRAFTIVYPGTGEDEEPYARMVWERYAATTEYNLIEQHIDDFFDSADFVVGLMDEPFHSPNILSILRIWQGMKAKGIRVTVKGDAGDELLAGYPGVYYHEYLWALAQQRQFRRLQHEITEFSEDPVEPFSWPYQRRLATVLAAGLRRHGGTPRHAVANMRHMRRARAAGFRCDEPPQMLRTGSFENTLIDRLGDGQMNYWLRVGNLASLSVPIEIRSPFLDHRVVEFVFGLPPSFLIRDGWLKWILREAMKDMLPPEIIWRRNKTGFPFPYRQWLAQSKDRFFAMARGSDVPYVDLSILRDQYDRLAREDPLLLWRMMITSLWWKRCIAEESLTA